MNDEEQNNNTDSTDVKPAEDAHPVEQKPAEDVQPVVAEKHHAHKHHAHAKKSPYESKSFLITTASIIGVIIIMALVVYGLGLVDKDPKTPVTGPKDGAVKLDFYVMSQCPYGTQVEDAVKPVLDKLGSDVDFNLNFIATDVGDGSFNSLHGPAEVQGDIVQLCAAKYDPAKYTDMVVCMNENAKNIPDNWESCAQGLDMDVDKIRSCYEGDEGKQLLSDSIEASNAVQARGSPTMFINDQPYQGGRQTNDFLRALCTELDFEPEACQEIPEPTIVKLTIVNDQRCEECNVDNLIAQLRSLFPGLKAVDFDYGFEEGKKLYEENELQYLPALLFDDSVKEGEGYAQVERYLIETPAGMYSLRIGAQFDPTAEICDNKIDDTGNGKVDCDDPTCEQSLECREEKKDDVQVFIMSDCPYGKKAVEALKGVIDNFGSKINYDIHYIASEAGDGFNSLHGTYEADEDIVQLCAKKYSPDKWFDYVYCRSVNGVKGIDWKQCADESGIDVAKVETCSTGDEGKELLREDIKIAESLQISASPTWLANNRYKFSGIDAETVKKNVCQYNEDLEGCENTLSADTGGVPSGSC